MYPSLEKKYAGVFVKNQVEEMIARLGQDSITIHFMKRTFTRFSGSVIKYLRFFLTFVPHLFRVYDAIIVHYFFPTFCLAYLYKLVRPNTRSIVIFHGSDINSKIQSKLSIIISKILLSKADFVIAVGNDLKSKIEAKLEVKVDEVLCAGIDSKVFYPQKIQKQYDFLFVGSLVERKGIKTLIEAIKTIDRDDISFCIVGSGPYDKEVKDLCVEKNVTHEENLNPDQLSVIYNQSKWFVFPSIDEPFGLVVTEAFFCGTPVIAYNSGGLKDQITDGHNGFLLTDFSVANLALKLLGVKAMSSVSYLEFRENALSSNKDYDLKFVCDRLVEISLRNG